MTPASPKWNRLSEVTAARQALMLLLFWRENLGRQPTGSTARRAARRVGAWVEERGRDHVSGGSGAGVDVEEFHRVKGLLWR